MGHRTLSSARGSCPGPLEPVSPGLSSPGWKWDRQGSPTQGPLLLSLPHDPGAGRPAHHPSSSPGLCRAHVPAHQSCHLDAHRGDTGSGWASHRCGGCCGSPALLSITSDCGQVGCCPRCGLVAGEWPTGIPCPQLHPGQTRTAPQCPQPIEPRLAPAPFPPSSPCPRQPARHGTWLFLVLGRYPLGSHGEQMP